MNTEVLHVSKGTRAIGKLIRDDAGGVFTRANGIELGNVVLQHEWPLVVVAHVFSLSVDCNSTSSSHTMSTSVGYYPWTLPPPSF